jgi:ABC-type glycerol-3-phosphate transport system substrate-binding protein
MKRHTLLRAATMTAACGGTGSSSGSGETVTVYSADGLANWYKPQLDKFTKDAGIAVNLVEAARVRWCPGWRKSSPTRRQTCW